MLARRFVIAVALVILTSVPASAFDGIRKGFILSGGGGLGTTSYRQSLASGSEIAQGPRESAISGVTDFRIGYGPTEQFVIYYFSHVSWFSFENVFNTDVTITHGTGGIGATYYFAPVAPSFLVLGGLGFSTWATPFEAGSETSTGFGLWFGGGFEFARHWSVEVTVAHGKPSTKEFGVELETSATTVSATINVLGY